jgi:hypothetical protein
MTDKAAREELWVSFRSLLRAYLSAATLGTDVPEVLLHDLPQSKLQIVSTRHTVSLECNTHSGEGYWAIFGRVETEEAMLDEGAFRLHLDGRMEWSGKPGLLEMDALAEALAMLVLE